MKQICDILLDRLAAIKTEPPLVRRRRVIVVDDNADAALLMKDVLTEEGCVVEIIRDPSKAVDAAAAAVPIERVFLDLHFPDGECGLAAMKQIRKLIPLLPITIISGQIDDRFIELAKTLGLEVLKKQDGIAEGVQRVMRRPA